MKAIFALLYVIWQLVWHLFMLGYAFYLIWFVDQPTMQQLGLGMALLLIEVAGLSLKVKSPAPE
jgi:hypothetical protein